MQRLLMTLSLSAVLASAPAAESVKPPPRPNIVIILADDLGMEALSCYGGANYKGLGPVKTPNLDAMAADGMRFTRCFATPVCSPARAELLTGKYSFRSGFTDIAGRNSATSQLDPIAHPTLPAQLKAAGYVTAVAGKWHIGPPDSMEEIPASSEADTDYPHPRACGFDRQCIFGGAHLENYGEPVPGKYTPSILQDWALRFLVSRKGKSEPFFLYYASPIPHVPLCATPLNPDGKPRNDKNFPFLVEYLDQQVGEIRAKLKELGMADNTLVLFSGDNGTNRKITTKMRNGRDVPGGKGTLQDTGSWVPLLADWPGVIAPGSVDEHLVDFSDILPTCLEIAGVNPAPGIDGVSFASQLFGKPGSAREWVQSFQNGKYFVRDDKWKLRENHALYNVTDSPYAETLITPENDTPEAKAARRRLQGAMGKVHPEGATSPAPQP